jgi:hypothetical protein
MARKELPVTTDGHIVFDSSELAFLDDVFGDVLKELTVRTGAPLPAASADTVRSKVARALFEEMRRGERDYGRLKSAAIEAVSAVPPSQA